MFDNPIVQTNISVLKYIGLDFIGPRMDEGKAKVATNEEIVEAVLRRLGKGDYMGKRVLVIGDPGRIDRESRWLRVTTGLLIATVSASAAVSAVRLVIGILQTSDFTSPTQLLTLGAIVWTPKLIAFASGVVGSSLRAPRSRSP